MSQVEAIFKSILLFSQIMWIPKAFSSVWLIFIFIFSPEPPTFQRATQAFSILLGTLLLEMFLFLHEIDHTSNFSSSTFLLIIDKDKQNFSKAVFSKIKRKLFLTNFDNLICSITVFGVLFLSVIKILIFCLFFLLFSLTVVF